MKSISLSVISFVAVSMLTAASADSWPINSPLGFMSEQEKKSDLNGDGINDVTYTAYDGGSGYKNYVGCFMDGKSKHKICTQDLVTTYSGFSGRRIVGTPSDLKKNKAAGFLSSQCSAQLSHDDKGQGALWLLRSTKQNLRWFSGKPWLQTNVCMSVKTAAKFTNALHWFFAESETSSPGPSWQVVFTSRDFRKGVKPHQALKPVLDAIDFQIFQHGHSLAIYWPKSDRHAWFLNSEKLVREDYKVDRWPGIKSVTLTSPKTLEVKLGDSHAAALSISVEALLPGVVHPREL